ncbi:Uridine kinase [Achromobacter denitrificans]|nr:Uridine kinase [Achromobacter denitrificans]
MKTLFFHPLFLTGLVIRLVAVALVTPQPVTEWYAPFLSTGLSQWNLDPWRLWLSTGGSADAFPYGYVMWLVFLPLALLAKLVGMEVSTAYTLTLMVVDALLLVLLQRLVPGRDRMLLLVYWLSPITLVATYWLGYNDLVPVALLTLTLYCIRQRLNWAAGVALAAAISAKLSMVAAFPFLLVYFLHNQPHRKFLPDFLRSFGLGIGLFLVPFALVSSDGLAMILSNPEVTKIYRLAMPMGGDITVYVVPLVYLLTLYAAWRVRRFNFDLLCAMLCIAFLMTVLLTPAAPGWFIWVLPFLVIYQASSDRIANALVCLFSCLYVATSLLADINAKEAIASLFGTPVFTLLPRGISIVHTALVATGVVLAVRIWREGVSRNDFFRFSRRPFVLGIAGDSGAGKDTYSDALKGLFGDHSVATLSGDDYHLWDRQRPMWQVMTHLNPMANDIEAFANDLVALTDGKSIQSRHYDHKSGRMSKPFKIDSNDFIFASGLHALYLPILRRCYSLSVYLDIDEELRRYLKLKRDVEVRGHTRERVLASFERREPDSRRFIRPQATHADLLFSLKPIHPNMLADASAGQQLRLKLVARSRLGLSEISLARALIGICGLHVDMVTSSDSAEVVLTIEGETTGKDIELAAKIICPDIFEFLDTSAKWADGVAGIMQLITLAHIQQALTKRFI